MTAQKALKYFKTKIENSPPKSEEQNAAIIAAVAIEKSIGMKPSKEALARNKYRCFCAFCGNELKTGQEFCDSCGQAQKWS